MNRQIALDQLRNFVEQAIGCGLFKSSKDVIVTNEAMWYLNSNTIDLDQLEKINADHLKTIRELRDRLESQKE